MFHLDDGFTLLLPDCVFEFVDVFPRPHLSLLRLHALLAQVELGQGSLYGDLGLLGLGQTSLVLLVLGDSITAVGEAGAVSGHHLYAAGVAALLLLVQLVHVLVVVLLLQLLDQHCLLINIA